MKTLYTFVFIMCCGLLLPAGAHAQTWDWAISNNPDFQGVVESSPTAADPYGNVISTGLMFNGDSISFGPYSIVDTVNFYKMFVLKADSSGNIAWMATTQSSVSQPLSIATDAAGSVYVLGLYFDTLCTIGSVSLINHSGGMMFFVVKFSPAGNVIWAHNIASSGMTISGGLAVDAECNVYATGTFNNATVTIGSTTLLNTDPAAASTDAFIVKYDSAGNNLWATSFGGAENDLGSIITVAPGGTCYVSGQFNSPTMAIGSDWLTDSVYFAASGTNYYPYYAKFLKDGTPVWAKTPYRHVRILDLKTDPTENLFMAGSIDSSVILGKDTLYLSGLQDALIAKYDGAGNIMWANAASGKLWSQAYSIVLDTCGNAWLAGSADSAMNFNGNIIPSPLVHNDKMFIAAYDHCGRYIPGSGIQLGSGGDDKLQIALDNRGHLFLGGDYTGIPMIFGNDTLQITPVGASEFFLVARYTYGPMPCDNTPCCYIIPVAAFADTGVGTVHFTYTGSPVFDSVRWNFGDGTTTDTLNPTHTYIPGTYHACLTVYTVCSSDNICRDINVPAGVTDATYDGDISIYPNPATDQFAVTGKAPFAAGTQLELFDIAGRIINTWSLTGHRAVISTKGLAPGLYHCRITTGNGTVINKQVVIK